MRYVTQDQWEDWEYEEPLENYRARLKKICRNLKSYQPPTHEMVWKRVPPTGNAYEDAPYEMMISISPASIVDQAQEIINRL